MTAPNIVNVQTITGATATLNLSTTSATQLVSNASSSSQVWKINSILVSNTSQSIAVDVTVNYYSAAALGGTAYPVANTVTVPAKSTMIILDKNNSIYLQENTSIGVTAATANLLNVICSYEIIS